MNMSMTRVRAIARKEFRDYRRNRFVIFTDAVTNGPGPDGVAAADGTMHGDTSSSVLALSAATGKTTWVDSHLLNKGQEAFEIPFTNKEQCGSAMSERKGQGSCSASLLHPEPVDGTDPLARGPGAGRQPEGLRGLKVLGTSAGQLHSRRGLFPDVAAEPRPAAPNRPRDGGSGR